MAKFFNPYIILIFPILTACGQTKSSGETSHAKSNADSVQKVLDNNTNDYHPVFEKANPKAQALLRDSFFFSPIEETAPFGSDDGADAYAGFKDWRKIHPSESTVDFVKSEIGYWKYPTFDLNETDFSKLKPFIESNELNIQFVKGTDEAIVATAFGELYLEGKIDTDIRMLAKNAIKRESLSQILKMWGKYAKEREQKLQKLLLVLNAPGI